MSDSAKRFASLAVSLGLGGLLLWLALRNADLGAVADALAEGEWGWFVPFLAASVLSVVVRAWRWGLLIDSLPDQREPTPLGLTTASVSIGYLVNYAAPRLGEVARTANVARRAKLPFTSVLGTVVAERVLDVIALALALLSVVVLFGGRVQAILSEAWATIQSSAANLPGWAVALSIVAVLVVAVLSLVVLRRGRGKLAGLLRQFRDGLTSVTRSRRPWSILGSTVALWACYGVMSDLPLRLLGLDAAYGLTPVDAWAVMAIGGIGMALPAPGGTGSFHYATIQALTLLFGVAVTPAATYAILVHAAGVVFYCVLGVLALAVQGTSFGSITQAARQA